MVEDFADLVVNAVLGGAVYTRDGVKAALVEGTFAAGVWTSGFAWVNVVVQPKLHRGAEVLSRDSVRWAVRDGVGPRARCVSAHGHEMVLGMCRGVRVVDQNVPVLPGDDL